jgi:2,3-dihydroxybiphenyl 1,2-dioxygenase
MAAIKELGYIGIEASDLSAWQSFGLDLLGLQLAEATDGHLVFRMDDKARRIVVHHGPADDLAYQGYDCGDTDGLDDITTRLQAAGHSVTDAEPDLVARRQVRRLRLTQDPMGNRVELYVGLADADTPFASDVTVSGFQTANGGAGHAILSTTDRQAALGFYGILGFTISDYIVQEIAPGFVLDAVFTHCNGRHHTLAFADVPGPKRMHHFMVEANSTEDVGMAWDRLVRRRLAPVSLTLGKHPNDRMFSFYCYAPSGFEWEYGADGLLILDEDAWEIKHYDRISAWGHIPAPLLAQALLPPA